ncbi:TadE/TadG family type IV pilus assembly protein [Hyphococcus formosus]|uniref:TadE/TadG family type IV pilus assembly protein n=1 Tax=Hyphococcus formosus TaxID=3143534 RepID=UPI00398A73FB
MVSQMRNISATSSLTGFVRRWKKAESGLAATEFAVLLPVLILLFFGLIEASNAMTVNRKVAISANTLADLVAQSEEIKESEVDDLFEGVMEMIRPNDPSGMTLKLSSVILDEDGDPVVHWSRDNKGGKPYAEGQEFTKLSDDTIIPSIASLIIVEMSYTYQPSITNRVMDTPIHFTRQTIRWPRLTTKVQLEGAGGGGDN